LKISQPEFNLQREKQNDRNFEKGGRSFYFFDFDENIAFLATPSFFIHQKTGGQVQLSSREFLLHAAEVGKSGPYKDYKISLDPQKGTFRCFRDQNIPLLKRLLGKRQMFVEDVAAALGKPDLHWKGPSWDYFYHAVFNGRPVALITARGHHPETVKAGIREMVKEGHLPQEPNYLGVYPVSHPKVLRDLGGEDGDIPALKRVALRKSVEDAMKIYGENAYHRFGMSDDDPRNLKWIMAEMIELKKKFPKNSFYVIETTNGICVKHEILEDGVEDQVCFTGPQIPLFNEEDSN
jgi:hypothetical protein